MQQRTVELGQRIKTLAAKYSELAAFEPPQRIPGEHGNIRFIGTTYDPGKMSFTPFNKIPRGDCWLRLRSRLATPDLHADTTEPYTPPANARNIYASILPGTDVIFEVELATSNTELIQEMEKTLRLNGKHE